MRTIKKIIWAVVCLTVLSSCGQAFGQQPVAAGAPMGASQADAKLKETLAKAHAKNLVVRISLKNPLTLNRRVIPSEKVFSIKVKSVGDACFDIKPLDSRTAPRGGCVPYDQIESASVESKEITVLKRVGAVGLTVVEVVAIIPETIVCLIFHKGCGFLSD
ncbi:MAG TPA: hypothetical protein VLZ81_10470 [Blastocatellia bacterium]|nr:hypothetical protein [Blastocatellia bacterium]